MRFTFLILVSIMVLMSCGGDKKNDAKSSNANKPSAKNIELSSDGEDENALDSKESSEETVAETSPPMTKKQLAQAKDIIKKTSNDKVKAVNASKVFKMRCASCHGFTGNMMVNGAKDLTKSKISLAESVAQVYFGKGLMTPFKGVMKDEEIVAVAKYIEKEIMK